jgi:Protein of unknown function (DUF1616)
MKGMAAIQTEDQAKQLIIETITREKPETSEQLEKLMLEKYRLYPDATTNLLIKLENEGKIKFTQPNTAASPKPTNYIFSQSATWFWAVIAISIITTITVFTIPENSFPIVYLRSVLGLIFVLFLPGYAFFKALFPSTLPINTNSESLESIIRITLSIGMSLALVPIVGLILSYTPWGIRLTPITLSLLASTTVCSIAAVLREQQIQTENYQNQKIQFQVVKSI